MLLFCCCCLFVFAFQFRIYSHSTVDLRRSLRIYSHSTVDSRRSFRIYSHSTVDSRRSFRIYSHSTIDSRRSFRLTLINKDRHLKCFEFKTNSTVWYKYKLKYIQQCISVFYLIALKSLAETLIFLAINGYTIL